MRDQYHRLVTWSLAFALAASVLGVIVVATSPPTPTPSYTEFYVLSDAGTAEGYPTNLTVGETGRVFVGITNHERADRTYTVALVLDDRTLASRVVSVESERTTELPVSFSASDPGRKRLRVLLYEGRDRTGEPYRRLRLWLNVSAPSG